MRVKTPKCVVAFATTTDAMAFEAKAASLGLPGRMIPLPSAISAGCGLAWCAPIQECDTIAQALAQHQVAYEGISEVELY